MCRKPPSGRRESLIVLINGDHDVSGAIAVPISSDAIDVPVGVDAHPKIVASVRIPIPGGGDKRVTIIERRAIGPVDV